MQQKHRISKQHRITKNIIIDFFNSRKEDLFLFCFPELLNGILIKESRLIG